MKIADINFADAEPTSIVHALLQKTPVSIVTVHAEMAYMAIRSKAYSLPIEGADIVLPDGVGLLLGLSFLGRKLRKCSGVDIASEVIVNSTDLPIFLWGGTKENVELAKDKIVTAGGRVAGFSAGYGYDKQAVFGNILSSGAKIVFVGMGGTAVQLSLVNEIKKELGVSALTVGGVIDLLAGKSVRAPKLFQMLGLEWMWRMMNDIKRIRKLPALFGFVGEVVKERLSSW